MTKIKNADGYVELQNGVFLIWLGDNPNGFEQGDVVFF